MSGEAVAGREQQRILVVDDEEAICEVLREFLSSEGYRVECLSDGAKARAALARDRFDVVIIDVVLRGERGLDFAEHATAIGAPVILMSGHPEFIALADESSYASLRKPFRLEEVRDLVRAVIASPRMRRAHAAAEDRPEL